MLTIRGLVLDGIAVTGIVVGIVTSVGCYLSNLPEPPEHVAVFGVTADDVEAMHDDRQRH